MLHRCNTCGKEISNDSESCPHCGQMIFPESARRSCGCLGAFVGLVILLWVAPDVSFGWSIVAFVVGAWAAISGFLWLTGRRRR